MKIVKQKKVKNVFSPLITKGQHIINVLQKIMISHGVLMKLIEIKTLLRVNGKTVMLHVHALLAGKAKTAILRVSFIKY